MAKISSHVRRHDLQSLFNNRSSATLVSGSVAFTMSYPHQRAFPLCYNSNSNDFEDDLRLHQHYRGFSRASHTSFLPTLPPADVVFGTGLSVRSNLQAELSSAQQQHPCEGYPGTHEAFHGTPTQVYTHVSLQPAPSQRQSRMSRLVIPQNNPPNVPQIIFNGYQASSSDDQYPSNTPYNPEPEDPEPYSFQPSIRGGDSSPSPSLLQAHSVSPTPGIWTPASSPSVGYCSSDTMDSLDDMVFDDSGDLGPPYEDLETNPGYGFIQSFPRSQAPTIINQSPNIPESFTAFNNQTVDSRSLSAPREISAMYDFDSSDSSPRLPQMVCNSDLALLSQKAARSRRDSCVSNDEEVNPISTGEEGACISCQFAREKASFQSP